MGRPAPPTTPTHLTLSHTWVAVVVVGSLSHDPPGIGHHLVPPHPQLHQRHFLCLRRGAEEGNAPVTVPLQSKVVLVHHDASKALLPPVRAPGVAHVPKLNAILYSPPHDRHLGGGKGMGGEGRGEGRCVHRYNVGLVVALIPHD